MQTLLLSPLLRGLVGLGLLLLSLGATAAGGPFPDVAQFLATLSPAPVWQVAAGDLDGDGLDDRAIVTHQPNSGVLPRLYVLLQGRDGGFRLAGESQTARYHDGAVELAIRKGSLYVTLEATKGMTRASHQFKLHRGEWRLIGMTHSAQDGAAPGPEAEARFLTLDLNVLTGDIIAARESAKGRRITRDKAVVGPCRLEQYDFDFGFCVADWPTRKGLSVSAYLVPD